MHSDIAIKIKPDFAEAWDARGQALHSLGNFDEARTSYLKAIELKADFAESLNNLGDLFLDQKQFRNAILFFDKAIQVSENFSEAWYNRGIALACLQRNQEALVCYDKSAELSPGRREVWLNRGNVLSELGRYTEALHSYDRAISVSADYGEAYSNKGSKLSYLKRHQEAVTAYECAIKLNPDINFLLGDLIHAQLKICDWTDLAQRLHQLRTRLSAGMKASLPFVILGLFDMPALQRRCAEVYSAFLHYEPNNLRDLTRKKKQRIRIGYFSMDFREHPVARLIAELIALHNRNEFEIYGFSFGIDTLDLIRKRIEGSFDVFLNVRDQDDHDISRLSFQHEIDIAIDLGGYTQDARPQIFVERAAPIQINYLGYPGTMGTKHIDYLIADSTLIPADMQEAYSEKIIYLPHCYQPNDSKRKISDRRFTRQELGLPLNKFVFCCFNNNWKIIPQIFDCWMKILQSVTDSVLWLFEDNPAVTKNLLKEAIKRSVDPNRLVFAKPMPHAEHLARHRLADVFLDTLPYNAHTTASDALWVGVPVLTIQGKSFAARVAASLLTSIGIPELITHSKEEYCSLAIELASNPQRLAAIKAKLTQNRFTTPLFDTKLFTGHIESAYQAAYDRYHSGLPADHIYVGP